MNRDKDYKRVLIALLLSNQNKSLKVMRVHLDNDVDRDYQVKINDDSPNGDWILSVEKLK